MIRAGDQSAGEALLVPPVRVTCTILAGTGGSLRARATAGLLPQRLPQLVLRTSTRA